MPCPVVLTALLASLSCSPLFGAADPSQSTAPNLVFESCCSHTPREMDLGANSYFMSHTIRFLSRPAGLCILTPPKLHSLRPSLLALSHLSQRSTRNQSSLCFLSGRSAWWLSCVLTPRLPCRSESHPEPNLWAQPHPSPSSPHLSSSPSSLSGFTAGFPRVWRPRLLSNSAQLCRQTGSRRLRICLPHTRPDEVFSGVLLRAPHTS